MKTIGIIQSNYLPWRGYFDFIQEVDTFVFLDDAQYTRRDWRNRNRIKTRSGASWISVPVNDVFGETRICDALINYETNWVEQHCSAIRAAYRKSAFFDRYFPLLVDELEKRPLTISRLNQGLCRWMASELNIETKLICSTELGCGGERSERLLRIVKELGGQRYLSGPSAECYLDLELFRSNGIDVAWKRYDYCEYDQLWGDFRGDVSALDLLFNLGEEAAKNTRSLTASVAAW